MQTLKELKHEFENLDKLKIFEIEVINKKTNETDFITFDIELRKNTLFAFHEALTEKQNKSKKIAFKKIVLDPCFSLYEHLQNLHDECINAIMESEYFDII